MATTVEELSEEVQRLVRSLSMALQSGEALDSNGNKIEVVVKNSENAKKSSLLNGRSYDDIIQDVISKIGTIEINPDERNNASQGGLIFQERLSNYIENIFKPRLKDEMYQQILGNKDQYNGIIDTFTELQKIIGTTEGANVTESLLAQLTAIRTQADHAITEIASAKIELNETINNRVGDAMSQIAGSQGEMNERLGTVENQVNQITTEYAPRFTAIANQFAQHEEKINLTKDGLISEMDNRDSAKKLVTDRIQSDVSSLKYRLDAFGDEGTIEMAIGSLKSLKIGDIWTPITPIL